VIKLLNRILARVGYELRSTSEEWWPAWEGLPELPPTPYDTLPNFRGADDEALALLMLHEVVMVSPRGKLFVLASDTFYWACADAEDLPTWPEMEDGSPLWNLYDLFRAHGHSGVTIWLVQQRKQRPIAPIVERLKANGLWSDEMDTYPEAS